MAFNPSWGARLLLCCSITPSVWISWSMGPPQLSLIAEVIHLSRGGFSNKKLLLPLVNFP